MKNRTFDPITDGTVWKNEKHDRLVIVKRAFNGRVWYTDIRTDATECEIKPRSVFRVLFPIRVAP